METVSIIVPIYNVFDYLTKCLDSILSQTYGNLEIVLVDDGSTDDSGALCDEYAEKDSRIVVIHKPNGGLISARKAGLFGSTASLVMFVDGDDWIEPTCVSRCIEAFSQCDVDIVCTGTIVRERNGAREQPFGSRPGYYSRTDIEREIFPLLIEDEHGKHFGTSLWGKLFVKSKLITAYRDVDDRITLGEDGVVTRPYMLHCNGMYVVNECLYDYNRENQFSMTNYLKPMEWNNTQMIRDRLLSVFEPLGDSWVEQINRNTAHNLLITSLSQFNRRESFYRTISMIRRELNRTEWQFALENTSYKRLFLIIMTFCLRHRLIMPIWLYSKLR